VGACIIQNPEVFTYIIPNLESLEFFTRHFPQQVATDAIEHLLNSDGDFARIIPNDEALQAFATAFPDYAERAGEFLHRERQVLL